MENYNAILDTVKKTKKPKVPVGFFEDFFEDLMRQIENESGVLGQLKKTNKPSLPTGYFDSLPLIDVDKPTFTIEDLKKTKKGTVPTNYFNKFPDQILRSVDEKDSPAKKGRVIPIGLIATIVSIAAVFAILFSVVDFSDKPEQNIISEVEISEDTDELYEDYLSYIDESEIIDFIIENDIVIEDSTDIVNFDEFSDFSEEEIEEYYLEFL